MDFNDTNFITMLNQYQNLIRNISYTPTTIPGEISLDTILGTAIGPPLYGSPEDCLYITADRIFPSGWIIALNHTDRVMYNGFSSLGGADLTLYRGGISKMVIGDTQTQINDDVRTTGSFIADGSIKCDNYDSNANIDLRFRRNDVEKLKITDSSAEFTDFVRSTRLRVEQRGSLDYPAIHFQGVNSTGDGIWQGSTGNLLITRESAVKLGIETTKIVTQVKIIPGSDGTTDLGESGSRWNDLWASNGTIQTSDEKEKQDIEDSPFGLSFLKQIRPVRYKLKKGTSGRYHTGLLSQDVKTALDKNNYTTMDFAGYVHDAGGQSIYDEDGNVIRVTEPTYGLRYSEFICPLIKCVHELSDRLEQLEQNINNINIDLDTKRKK